MIYIFLSLNSNSWVGRFPGKGNSNPLQYSFLENPMVRGDWQATVHGIARVGHGLATKPPPPIVLWSEKMLDMISIFSNLPRLDL